MALAVVGGSAAMAALGVVCYVYGHKPDEVKRPCWRTFHRADGKPKKSFDSAAAANWQSVKQLFLKGEVCNPYQADGKYYTGHSKYASVRSLNPFKKGA